LSVQFIQDFGLLSVQFIQDFGLLSVWFIQDFGLFSVWFIQDFGLFSVWFIQDFGLFSVWFIQDFGLFSVRFRHVSLYYTTSGATSGAGTTYPSGALEVTSGIHCTIQLLVPLVEQELFTLLEH
jgi:hypothetical protein